jgi:hypothetical protein
MTARRWTLAMFLLALVAPSAWGETSFSRLSLPVLPAGAPESRTSRSRPGEEWLAQRSIDREWGPSDDSTYREIDVPGWKSEGAAMLLSGLAPGVGHFYLGESGGWAFALAELGGWMGHWYEVHTARKDWNKLVAFVGDPNDPNATFSFERYRNATNDDTADLEALWAGDHAAFYRELSENPVYRQGFDVRSGEDSEAEMHDILGAHDDASRRQWLFDAALWANHVLAALDALRAARSHNAPLRETYHLDVGERWRNGEPELHAALVRRF